MTRGWKVWVLDFNMNGDHYERFEEKENGVFDLKKNPKVVPYYSINSSWNGIPFIALFYTRVCIWTHKPGVISKKSA